MMIVPLAGIGLVAVSLLVLLRNQRPEMAVLFGTAVSVSIFLFLIGPLTEVIALLQELAVRAQVNLNYVVIVLKIIAVAYIAEFGAQIARDAGEGAVAEKFELAGKVLILVMAVPIVTGIVDLVLKMME